MIHDIAAAVGAVMAFAGLWMVSPAWALIVTGSVLVGASVVAATRKGRN